MTVREGDLTLEILPSLVWVTRVRTYKSWFVSRTADYSRVILKQFTSFLTYLLPGTGTPPPFGCTEESRTVPKALGRRRRRWGS